MTDRLTWKILAILLILTATGGCVSAPTVKPTPPAPTETSLPTAPPAAPAPTIQPEPPTPRSFRIGIRVTSKITQAQIDFINDHYDYVMTPFLSQEVRDSIQQPQLILYRSIQGTWTGFNQFDWAHIDAHENMFCHHHGERILTRWNSWLMDPNDMVDPDDPEALNHWINYYAVTAAEQIYQYNYDGLFIDSAGHKLSPGAVYGKMPDDYDPQRWKAGRMASLKFIKSYLPDKSVVFNGLHSRAGAEESLANTDGGMWEVFAFEPTTGRYYGLETWREVIELTARHNQEKAISLVVKEQPGLTKDLQKRMFVVASYLLVSNQNVIFSMSDLDYSKETILYYPEYDLYLGEPLGSYTVDEQGVFIRRFAEGIVLVNPGESETLIFAPDGDYQQVIPVGGGMVSPDGGWEGSITYEPVGDRVELFPMSGAVLVHR